MMRYLLFGNYETLHTQGGANDFEKASDCESELVEHAKTKMGNGTSNFDWSWWHVFDIKEEKITCNYKKECVL